MRYGDTHPQLYCSASFTHDEVSLAVLAQSSSAIRKKERRPMDELSAKSSHWETLYAELQVSQAELQCSIDRFARGEGPDPAALARQTRRLRQRVRKAIAEAMPVDGKSEADLALFRNALRQYRWPQR
jgi:hypothetical protein